MHRIVPGSAGRLVGGACGLLLAIGCATLSTGQPSPESAAYPAVRLVGKVLWATADMRAGFDVALLIDPQRGRVRVDVALPTGATGGMLWVLPDRWILYDPSANMAFTGVPSHTDQLADTLPPLYQAPLALIAGLGQLSPRWGFDKIPVIATNGSIPVTGRSWTVNVSELDDDFSLPWPRHWRVKGATSELEVSWSRLQPLMQADMRLFEPRLPASVSLRSWRALQPVSAVTESSAGPILQVPSRR